jgi:endonuclease-3
MQLAAIIRVAGLANIKARRIQDALLALESQYGTLDLDFLKDLPLEEARNVLLGLPGIGPKTASCVLLFSCGHPALPVDTHVHRLAQRLGLIGRKDSAERAHIELSRLVPLSDVYDFHVNLISHGRQVCHARNPSCDVCILRSDCTYVKQETRVFETYDVSPATGMPGRGTRGTRAAVVARFGNRRVGESGQ